MAERGQAYPWIMRGLYAVLCLFIMFLHLLPLDTIPRGWAGPDLMIAITFAWVLRRPELAPPLLIAAMFLLADLLFQRPPGLWAALVLLGSQTLRARAGDLRDLTFAIEWLSVTTTLVAMTLGYRVILSIVGIDQTPLGLSLIAMVLTIAIYPPIVLVSYTLFGIRKISPHELKTIRSGL